MAQPPLQDIASRVRVMLEGADLDVVTAKTVRQSLEQHFSVDLSDRKKEIGRIINEFINSDTNGDSKKEREDREKKVERKEVEVKEERRRSPSLSSTDDEELARRLQAEEQETQSKRATRSGGQNSSKRKSNKISSKDKKKKKKSRDTVEGSSKSGSNCDSDSGSEADKGKRKDKGVKKSGAKKGGYLKALTLSNELANFMGANEMPRHEVVSRVWKYCKENNLQDPKNKQFAVTDENLRKIFGPIKRFRMFGMMKLLSKHFHVDQ